MERRGVPMPVLTYASFVDIGPAVRHRAWNHATNHFPVLAVHDSPIAQNDIRDLVSRQQLLGLSGRRNWTRWMATTSPDYRLALVAFRPIGAA
jgi:hypothetical protein